MPRTATVDDFRLSEARFNETGASVGEMAALLTDAADCMTYTPSRFSETVSAADWPSFERLQTMTATWLDRRDELIRVWEALSQKDRAAIGPLPDFDTPDPLLPLV